MMNLKLISFLLILITFVKAETRSLPMLQVLPLEKEYVQLERLYSICAMVEQMQEYASYPIDLDELKKLWHPPTNCSEITQHLKEVSYQLSSNQTNLKNNFYPLYSELLRSKTTPNLKALVPFQNPDLPINKMSANTISPWVLEQELRSLNMLKDSHCSTFDIDPINHYDNNFWHQLFITEGYDCVVNLYKKTSKTLHPDQQRLQNAYEINLQELESTDLFTKNQTKILKKMKDTVVVYVPQLGHDIPPVKLQEALKFFVGLAPSIEVRTEILRSQELKKFFNRNNIPFYVLNRTTLHSMDQQVHQTLKGLKSVVIKEGLFHPYSKKKILVLTRSMGGLVARLTLKKDPSVNKYIKGVILIGSTPYGSVIADYKSRGDVNFFTVTNRIKGSFFNHSLSHVVPVLKASLNRANLETMSHALYTPFLDQDPIHNYPIINLIFLRDHAYNYFETLGSKVPNVDLTFLNMVTYGPTEGSSLLTHAAWDTPHSVRLFDSRLNHLGFWGLNSDEGLKVYEAILTVMEHWPKK